MKESAGVLQQAKFIALVLKLILVSIIWETRNVHIYASCPPGTGKEDDAFKTMNTVMNTLVFLFWIVGIIEFLHYFKAATIFNNKGNLLAIFVHFFSILLLLNFKNTAGNVAEFFGCVILAG